MKLYRTRLGIVVETIDGFYRLGTTDWDALINSPDLMATLQEQVQDEIGVQIDGVLVPLVSQEVWAAGVTYYKSRDARMEEAAEAGGDDFYARVYDADRPELFFKSTASRTVGHLGLVRIRSDSKWNVPEPELAIAVNKKGKIIGYTVGNDMSSRDIEGANPLYLPQAKVYDRCCALGPGVLVTEEPMPASVEIRINVMRDGKTAFAGTTTLAQLKRKPSELVEWLFRDNAFPHGCFLLTGTGIVPPSEFTLASGDVIRISIDLIGTLENRVL